MESSRSNRKTDHIIYSLVLEKEKSKNYFDDITIIHNCLPEINLDDIDMSTSLCNLHLKTPIIINAMTGGSVEAEKINQNLAKIAKEENLAIAVGSQKIALREPKYEKSFKIVRKVNPHGLVFANLGAESSVEDAQKAIDMLDADAIQIHLNVPQEIAMPEGRRKFKGMLENIESILKNINVPVIVKEVGFGIAKEEAKKLVDIGVKIVDISGKGGTNFLAIENKRNKENPLYNLENWGIPTPASLLEVVKTVGEQINIIASGGLRTGLDAAKSLALGAKATGFSGSILYILLTQGYQGLKKYIQKIKQEISSVMLMTGAKNLKELRQRPVIISGDTRDWIETRKIKA